MTPVLPTNQIGFTDEDRKVLNQIPIELKYLGEAIKDHSARLHALETDHVGHVDLEAKANHGDLSKTAVEDHERRLKELERHPMLCPIRERVEVLEGDKLQRDSAAAESHVWAGYVGAVLRYGVVPLLALLAGHLVWK